MFALFFNVSVNELSALVALLTWPFSKEAHQPLLEPIYIGISNFKRCKQMNCLTHLYTVTVHRLKYFLNIILYSAWSKCSLLKICVPCFLHVLHHSSCPGSLNCWWPSTTPFILISRDSGIWKISADKAEFWNTLLATFLVLELLPFFCFGKKHLTPSSS